MSFRPLKRMWERVENDREESDHAYFDSLLLLGEMLFKTVTLALVAAVRDEKDRLRYQQLHALARADGIGDWTQVVNAVLTGPAAQHFIEASTDERTELTKAEKEGSWQHSAVVALHRAVHQIDPAVEQLGEKVPLRRCFDLFARLRNATRGHGALPSRERVKLCVPLEESLRILSKNLTVFNRQWAYLNRNFSGKYRVAKLSDDSSDFDYLKSIKTESKRNGVYVFLGRPVLVELADSDIDASDFFLANGGFNDKTFELLSYMSGQRRRCDSGPYQTPATALPESSTQGLGTLEPLGRVFGNLPPPPAGYVTRQHLEHDLETCLSDDRHPIVTLVGRGGIGKTSLALACIHRLTTAERFNVILWFSARDIDLLPQGPKPVRPQVLGIPDIAEEYAGLIGAQGKGKKWEEELLSRDLGSSELGPTLFVFDNFETLINPGEVFTWIDTYVRNPNKILVTTRARDFRGDYPIEVAGMSEAECTELIDRTAAYLGIGALLSDRYRSRLCEESAGHPYVIKVLLGEVAKAGKEVANQRIMAGQSDILVALFERTFSNLSPAAVRVFLTLCKWNTTVPLLALRAVLLCACGERPPVDEAVGELERCCFVEVSGASKDSEAFITVPLAAALFGRSKLSVSPFKSEIEADVRVLQEFGAGLPTDSVHGVAPKLRKFVSFVLSEMQSGRGTLEKHRPVLECLATRYRPLWLDIARLLEEAEPDGWLADAKNALQRYLEGADPSCVEAGWGQLAALCRRSSDPVGELHALAELAELPAVPFYRVSDSASRFNQVFHDSREGIPADVRRSLSERLLSVLQTRIGEATADDLSRMAWLCMNMGRDADAKSLAQRGLKQQPGNSHCLSLVERLARTGRI